jgi:hypothetical protein
VHKVLLASAILFGVGLGCLASTVAQDFMVPKVRAGTSPTTWEYQCYYRSLRLYEPDKQLTKLANNAGKEGWEMSGGVGGEGDQKVCFRRPLP